MNKLRTKIIVFLVIPILIISLIFPANISKSDDLTDIFNVTIEKYVRVADDIDSCVDSNINVFKKQISALYNDNIIFKIYVNNTGDSPVNVTVYDEFPPGLSYNNHAIVDGVAEEPLFIDTNTFLWNLFNLTPGQSVIITFLAIVEECGTHVNLVKAIGGVGDQIVHDEDIAVVSVSCDEPEIIIEKMVWNGTVWADYAEVYLEDTVQFRGEVHNPNDYEIDFSGIIYDIFPDNLRYVNESCTLLDFSPNVIELVDWENNNVTWHRIPILPAGETFTFYYNATAVDCGLRINNIFTQAFVVYSPENTVPVYDSDDATVNVICEPPPCINISVEKYVRWDCTTTFKKYVEAPIGGYVTIKLIVNNTGVFPLDIIVIDELPSGLSYINYAEPEPDDINENIITWYFYDVEPDDSIVITFDVNVDELGKQINFANATGTYEDQTVYDEDNATVNVICNNGEPQQLEIIIDNGFNIGNLNAFIKNNGETDLSDVTWSIIVKNIGLFRRIDSTTIDTIELLIIGEKKILKTESIRGFGLVKIIAKATAPELDPVTITASGFVLGRIIIVLSSG